MPLQKLIAVVGPTASGKTSLGLRLAQQLSGYIISADSRQIYIGMDIGTAKETKQERVLVPHFLIDITAPDHPFSLAEIQQAIFKIIEEQHKKNPTHIPFLVGGTGLYINSVVDHWILPPGKPLTEQRKKWDLTPLPRLVQELKKLDPAALALVDIKNSRRVIRALEIVHDHGKLQPMLHQRGPQLFDVLMLGLQVEKTELDQRINTRVDQQIKQGLVEEVQKLARAYSWDLPALSGIGYAEIGQYIQQKIDLPEAIELIKLHTRQYARRQMTWFKRDQRIHWVTSPTEAEGLIEKFMLGRLETSVERPE